jgi:CHAT domain-containing protein
VLLVAGPGLDGGTDEVTALAEKYPQARVLAGGDATAERVLHHMDGAWLVHLAAHGRFRSDNPLFSAVELADGPLTGYDLERLHQAPHQMVLSSCSSATSAPTGADELMGIVTPLVSRGCAGVVASVVPVNDPATVPLMLALHQRLTAGTPLSQALSEAGSEVEAADLPAARVTAGSFVAMGC